MLCARCEVLSIEDEGESESESEIEWFWDGTEKEGIAVHDKDNAEGVRVGHTLLTLALSRDR